ncbi:MAG TPA: NAD(P)-dependent oxidoreductase [Ruania sp.]|nr:NAD(P)-dependent oxidoreductase [Ruania sp.]
MKVLLPNSIPLHPHLPEGVSSFVYDTHAAIPPEHRDAEALVIWQSPAERLATMPHELPHLRWIQSLMAGTDSIEAAGFDPAIRLTSGKGLHDRPVAEHTLALILSAARRLHQSFAAQRRREWRHSWDADRPFASVDSFSTLTGARVLIWGFGGIGTLLAEYLTVLGAEVTGIARSSGERGGHPVRTPAELPQLLPDTDVLVNILPATTATAGIVDERVLRALPPRAWVVNVGRGATVDEPALLHALESGMIAGAALDVFATEPLPADSPLWHAPNMIVTPHAAGGRPHNPEALIEQNLQLLLSDAPLVNEVGA